MVKNQKGVWYLKTVLWCTVCGKEEWYIERQPPERPEPEPAVWMGGTKVHVSSQYYCGCMDYELYG
jgi:hypothetical protein